MAGNQAKTVTSLLTLLTVLAAGKNFKSPVIIDHVILVYDVKSLSFLNLSKNLVISMGVQEFLQVLLSVLSFLQIPSKIDFGQIIVFMNITLPALLTYLRLH